MYVVYFAVHLDHFSFEVTANLGEDSTKAVDRIGVKYLFPIFCQRRPNVREVEKKHSVCRAESRLTQA